MVTCFLSENSSSDAEESSYQEERMLIDTQSDWNFSSNNDDDPVSVNHDDKWFGEELWIKLLLFRVEGNDTKNKRFMELHRSLVKIDQPFHGLQDQEEKRGRILRLHLNGMKSNKSLAVHQKTIEEILDAFPEFKEITLGSKKRKGSGLPAPGPPKKRKTDDEMDSDDTEMYEYSDDGDGTPTKKKSPKSPKASRRPKISEFINPKSPEEKETRNTRETADIPKMFECAACDKLHQTYADSRNCCHADTADRPPRDFFLFWAKNPHTCDIYCEPCAPLLEQFVQQAKEKNPSEEPGHVFKTMAEKLASGPRPIDTNKVIQEGLKLSESSQLRKSWSEVATCDYSVQKERLLAGEEIINSALARRAAEMGSKKDFMPTTFLEFVRSWFSWNSSMGKAFFEAIFNKDNVPKEIYDYFQDFDKFIARLKKKPDDVYRIMMDINISQSSYFSMWKTLFDRDPIIFLPFPHDVQEVSRFWGLYARDALNLKAVIDGDEIVGWIADPNEINRLAIAMRQNYSKTGKAWANQGRLSLLPLFPHPEWIGNLFLLGPLHLQQHLFLPLVLQC